MPKDEHGNELINVNKAGVVIINPGTFGMSDATEENAIHNMAAFLKDCQHSEELSFERAPSADYGEGRYCFIVRRQGFERWIRVQMPGRALEHVRYMDSSSQNIWHFPRLYVDDSSWVWLYAILKDEDWQDEDD